MKGNEYFKVIDLVKHYQEHQSGERAYTDFIDFLSDHYLKKSHHEKEHGSLPFKSQQIQQIVAFCFFRKEMPLFITSIEIPEQMKTTIFNEMFSSSYNGSIWIPPQLV